MSEGCPRPAPAGRPVRGPHGGWQQQEIDVLERTVSEAAQTGQSLRSVFERVSEELGRKPNSIRNFYYAQLRTQEGGAAPRALPFETFAPEEVEQLVERVLTARGQGKSVRACVRELSGGDKTRMLRYQNKYRSTVRTRPELVHRVMDRLSEQGVPFVSPYPQKESAQTGLSALRGRAAVSGDPQLTQLFDGLSHLLDLALSNGAGDAQEDGNAPRDSDALRDSDTPGDGDALRDSDALRRADRLNARCDMLRIALSDEQERRTRLAKETGGMVTLLKEYIALPEAERGSRTEAFCHQAAQRLSAVECAMMDE